ncbi:hypothetical protein ACFV2Q_18400 [Streptomyces sp. NPDC059650]|uniref:hypothetical protein n=1 Tax=Streptomyces sp. NPDC059650 TaxID=3346896 RepID=UPI00369588B9
MRHPPRSRRPGRRRDPPAVRPAPTRIASLPTTARTAHGGTAYLALGRTPIPLPTSLTDILSTLADRPTLQGWAANTSACWLFPGHLPGAHISAAALSRRLAALHIPNRSARTTALVALACDLPPAVLGPMLGLHPITAVQWRRRAATDWTAYLEARTAAGDQGQDRTGRQHQALKPDSPGRPGAILHPGV